MKAIVEKGKGAGGGFSKGISSFVAGQRFVWQEHRELLSFCLWPMLAGALFFVGTGVLFYFNIENLANSIWTRPDNWFMEMLWYLVAALAVAAGGLMILVTAWLVFMIVSAPFNDVISEKVEEIEGTWAAAPFSWSFLLSDAGHSMWVELAKVGQKLLWLVPLFLCSLLIPVVGHLAYLIVGGYKLAGFLGMDYVDWSLARRGYSGKERFDFAKEHKWSLLGFGTAMTFALLVPFGAVLFWPGAVAGGTLLCTGLGPQDRRKPSEQLTEPQPNPGTTE